MNNFEFHTRSTYKSHDALEADIQLKPCPFCGGTAKLHRLGGKGSTHAYVDCRHCGAETPFKPTFEAAAEAWNTRAEPVAAALDPLAGTRPLTAFVGDTHAVGSGEVLAHLIAERSAEAEVPETYVARMTVQPSAAVARKLRSTTKPALRISEDD